MRLNKIKNLLFLFFIFIVTANAQEPVAGKAWSMEQCIDYALKNNISVKQSELNTEISEVNLKQSKANLLPELNGSASHLYDFGLNIDRVTNELTKQEMLSENLALNTDVNLFSGWQNINNIKQNRYNYQAGKFDIDKMKNDISLNVASDYLQILYNIESLENAKNQMGITAAQVDRTQKLVDAGAAAKGTLLDIQAQLATEELNVTNAQNNLDISYLTLAQLLNMSSAEGFTIVKPEINIAGDALLTSNPTQIYNSAVANLPEMKSADLKVKSAERGVSSAWGALSPRLSLVASYGTSYSSLPSQLSSLPAFEGYAPNGSYTSRGDTVLSPLFSNPTFKKASFMDQYKDNANKYFGFNLTVPIFNRFQTKLAIDKAKIQKINAELTVESTKLQIQKNIQQAFADASAALKNYASSQKALIAMEESFKYTEQKFNVGMVNTTDYNTAKNKLITSQSQVLQAKYQFVFKTKVLDFYQGKPLKF